jgi:hypothetical protein
MHMSILLRKHSGLFDVEQNTTKNVNKKGVVVNNPWGNSKIFGVSGDGMFIF